MGGFYQRTINFCSRHRIGDGSNSSALWEKALKTASVKAEKKWLIGFLLLAVALGILVGAIVAGRLRFRFPW